MVFKLAEDLEVLPVEVAKVSPISPLYLPCISRCCPSRSPRLALNPALTLTLTLAPTRTRTRTRTLTLTLTLTPTPALT